jgi:DNA-directed RNA polymerase subunit beta
LIDLSNSRTDVDDIDHLSNRRVRTVGEQLYSQFGVGLARMARTIRERMNIRDNEVFTPTDLINARTWLRLSIHFLVQTSFLNLWIKLIR